jgi:glutamate formiminotransferase
MVECVPNFSEGMDPQRIGEIAERIRNVPGVSLFDYSADADHHRSVFTFGGPRDAVMTAAMAAAGVAVEQIDLNRHRGVHPRIGAIDVVPFVPLHGTDLTGCTRLAWEFGERLWARLRIPVFFYESAALRPEFRSLEQLRRNALDGAAPDIGQGRHATAGACAVGARNFLVAWNIWLETADLRVAKQIARAVRASSGGLAGVKALGLPLESQGIVQVSINSTDFRATPIHVVFDAVRRMAADAGVRLRGAELIGMIPAAAVESEASREIPWMNLCPERILCP